MLSEEIMSKEAFEELIRNLEIVASLTLYGRKSIKYWVTKLQKENEEQKTTINKQSLDISNNLIELQQKDRQIDLMAKMIDELSEHYTRYHGKNNEFCKEICLKKDIDCIDCIKQYFETKAKKEQ